MVSDKKLRERRWDVDSNMDDKVVIVSSIGEWIGPVRTIIFTRPSCSTCSRLPAVPPT